MGSVGLHIARLREANDQHAQVDDKALTTIVPTITQYDTSSQGSLRNRARQVGEDRKKVSIGSQLFERSVLIVYASRNPTSPHQTSGLVSSKLGQRFGDGPGVDLGGFWGGLGAVESGWATIGWAEGWPKLQPPST